LAFSYWIDIPWFLTEEKLAVVLITPSLGVPNWPVIYIINYTPAKHQQVFWHYSTPCHHNATRNMGEEKENSTCNTNMRDIYQSTT
jgi:hypothetical protein